MNEVVSFLSENRQTLLMLHLFSMGLGLGAATVSDVLFFRFLKDLKITEEEAGTLSTLSMIIWTALGLIVLSGIGLYLPASERLLDSAKFMAKMTVFAVLLTNGIVLNTLISPRLTHIFGQEVNFTQSPRYIRRITFALGSVSIISWYTTFTMGAWRGMPYSYGQVICAYVSLLAIGIITSQIMEHRFHARKQK